MKNAVHVMLAALALSLASCATATSSGVTPSLSAVPTPIPGVARPSSPVRIQLISPYQNEVIHGTTMKVVVKITGGTISRVTTTHISPTVGHVHLLYDNALILMSYTLTQDVPVHPGENGTLTAEFVASDHFPFNPRDITPPVYFSVQP
jgi:hypothetical protein